MDLIVVIVIWAVIAFVSSFFNKLKRDTKTFTEVPDSSKHIQDYLDQLSEEELEDYYATNGEDLSCSLDSNQEPNFPSSVFAKNTSSITIDTPNQKSLIPTQKQRASRGAKQTPLKGNLRGSDYRIQTKSELKKAVVWSEILKRKY